MSWHWALINKRIIHQCLKVIGYCLRGVGRMVVYVVDHPEYLFLILRYVGLGELEQSIGVAGRLWPYACQQSVGVCKKWVYQGQQMCDRQVKHTMQ